MIPSGPMVYWSTNRPTVEELIIKAVSINLYRAGVCVTFEHLSAPKFGWQTSNWLPDLKADHNLQQLANEG